MNTITPVQARFLHRLKSRAFDRKHIVTEEQEPYHSPEYMDGTQPAPAAIHEELVARVSAAYVTREIDGWIVGIACSQGRTWLIWHMYGKRKAGPDGDVSWLEAAAAFLDCPADAFKHPGEPWGRFWFTKVGS